MKRRLSDVAVQIVWPVVMTVGRLLPARFSRWLHEPPEETIVA